MVDTFMRLDAVKAATGLGRSTIYEMMDLGTFPKSVKLNEGSDARAVAWVASEIAKWQRSRIEAREKTEAA